MGTDQFTEFIEQIADDPKAMTLFERVLETTLAHRRALTEFRVYMTPHHGGVATAQAATSTNKHPHKRGARARSNSLTRRAFQFVMASSGKPVATETIATQLGASEAQVRGALKRFVREGTISKPRRGLWLRVEAAGRMNGKVASATHATH
jgi:hypothetical protein